MFTCQLVSSLADVCCLKEILAPETHQFFSNSKRSTNIVDRYRLSILQFAEDGCKMLLGLDLLFLETAFSRQYNWLFLGCFEFSSLIHDISSIGVHQLPIIILDQHLHSFRSIPFALCTWVCRNSDNPQSIELTKVVILELLTDSPWD